MTSNTLKHDIEINNEYIISEYIMSGYNLGKVDEIISRIDKKLEDLCKELKELNTILEN